MTRLFQAVIDAGGEPDASNDDLQSTPSGYVWECPVVEPIAPKALLDAAVAQLGDICRGVEVDPLFECVRIFLTSRYED